MSSLRSWGLTQIVNKECIIPCYGVFPAAFHFTQFLLTHSMMVILFVDTVFVLPDYYRIINANYLTFKFVLPQYGRDRFSLFQGYDVFNCLFRPGSYPHELWIHHIGVFCLCEWPIQPSADGIIPYPAAESLNSDACPWWAHENYRAKQCLKTTQGMTRTTTTSIGQLRRKDWLIILTASKGWHYFHKNQVYHREQAQWIKKEKKEKEEKKNLRHCNPTQLKCRFLSCYFQESKQYCNTCLGTHWFALPLTQSYG